MSEYTNSWILHLGVLLYGKTERKVIMQSQYENFIQARNNDVSIQELCEQFNISKSTAYNWIKKYSLVKRTKGRTISVHKIC